MCDEWISQILMVVQQVEAQKPSGAVTHGSMHSIPSSVPFLFSPVSRLSSFMCALPIAHFAFQTYNIHRQQQATVRAIHHILAL